MISPEYLPLLWALGMTLATYGAFKLVTYVQHRKGAPEMSWKEFAQIIEKVAPLIPLLVPGIPPVLIPAIVHGIQVAEAIPGADGKTKKAAAVEIVSTAISVVNSTAATEGTSKQVIDPSVINAVSNGIDTAVGIVNVVKRQPVAPDADLASN